MLLSRPVRRTVSLSVLLVALVSACNPIAASIPPPQAANNFRCPVTLPTTPGFVPPGPYPSPPDGYFWYGSDALWTGLPNDGIWRGLPRHEDGYGQKFFVWRVGYDPMDEPEPALTVNGQSLDSDASPLTGHVPATHAFGPDIHSAMLTGITFPSAGCWEVRATYSPSSGDSSVLIFVVEIEE